MDCPKTVSWQNKFVKLVHLVGFITKKFVTMNGHMNIKNYWKYIVVNVITCSFGYGTLIGEIHGSVWPQYGHRAVVVLRLCC